MTVRPWLILFALFLPSACAALPVKPAVALEPFRPFAVAPGSYVQDPAFSPRGKTLYLTMIDAKGVHTIVRSVRRGRAWSVPRPVSFSGRWRDLEEVLSPDGHAMFFASNRPTDAGGRAIAGFFGGRVRPQRGGNLWLVRWRDGHWGTARRLPDGVNSNDSVFSPAIAGDGTLYFMRASGPKMTFHIFIAARSRGAYHSSSLAPFSDPQYSDFDPTVDPNDSFVIFSSNRPPAMKGTDDLFISFRRGGRWTTPRDMGQSIDPNGDAIEARLSPAARALYFVSGTPSSLWKADLSPWLGEAGLPRPALLAPGVISDLSGASSPAFSPDKKTLLFMKSAGAQNAIFESHLAGGKWSTPVPASFSGKWNDMDPAFAPDGSYLVFSSVRPVPNSATPVANLWRVDRTPAGWSAPVHLPAAVNIANYIFAPSIARDGTIYFLRSSKRREHQLYRSQLRNGIYRQAEPLAFSRPATDDYDPATAPDQSFVVFASGGRGMSSDEKLQLYIVREHDGRWGQVRPLRYAGDESTSDSGPVIARDGKTLYFTRDAGGVSELWTMPLPLR